MYVYDDIDRLIEANSQMYGGNMVYQYDKIGNMLYNCRKGYYEYDSDHPHAVKRIKKNGVTVESYNYDPNGNMYSGGNRTLTYDYDNRPTSIIYNGTATVNVYDATGNRIQKMISAPSQDITKYIGQLYECNGGQCTKYIFAGTRRIAQVKGSDTYYYHTDHLESSTVITDQNGNKVEELLYYPFGEILSDSSPTKVKYKFAGHEFDSETELIYMKARYYDPKLARFISPDPVVPVRVEQYNYRDFKMTQFRQLTNPQALNRYSYVANNPIVFRDPFGLDKVSTWLGIGSYGVNTVGLAFAPAKWVGVGVSFVAIGYSAYQYNAGNMSGFEASRNIGLAVTDAVATGLGKLGHEAAEALIGGISRGLGVPNTAYDAVDTAAKSKETQPPVAKPESYNPSAKPETIAPPIDNSGSSKGGAGVESTSKQLSPSDATSQTKTETPVVPVSSTGQGQLGGSSTTSQPASHPGYVGSSGYVPSSGNTYVGGDYGC
jgi:RHS repeat-associated protein